MSRTNCLLPKSGFCLNLRVRTVKSPMVAEGGGRMGGGEKCVCGAPGRVA